METKDRAPAPHLGATVRLRRAGRRHFLQALAGGFLLLATASRPASAAGLVCRQDCSKGPCAQTECALVKPGAPSGFCRCNGAAEVWGDTIYAAWCSAWGRPPEPACAPLTPGVDANGRPLAQPPAQLANAAAMALVLRGRNPYVATLVRAMQDGSRWLEGPVEGLVHDSFYDASRSDLSHTPVLRFTGRVDTAVLDIAQVDITVSGDIKGLTHLKHHADAATPSAVPPQFVHGTVTAGGAHGSLQVIALDGRSETIQW